MNKYYPLAVAAMLGVGAFMVPSMASAAPIPIAGQTGTVTESNDLLQDVRHRCGHNRQCMDGRDRFNRRWDGSRYHRYRYRYGPYRHFYGGYWYDRPYWSFSVPLIIGGTYGYSAGYGSAHVRWCMNRYRSYNPRTNTWLSYSGEVRQCHSPYRY